MSVGILAGNVASITVIEQALTPAEVATIVAPAQTFTVPGLKTTDAVIVNPPGQQAGVAIANAYVSAADTLSIQFVNPTAGALTPTAGTHKITVIRMEGLVGAKRVMT
jgi:hypothetical protein